MAMQPVRSGDDAAFGADLTARQQMIFDFLIEHVSKHGYPPTVREIGEFFSIRSTNGVHDHLRALEKKGYVTREDKASRGLTLAKPPESMEPRAAIIPPGPRRQLARRPIKRAPAASGPSATLTRLTATRPSLASAAVRAGHGGARTVAILGRVAAGVPIPAVEDADDVITLDERLTGGGEVFALRVVGRSMIDAGILPEDLILVRPSHHVENGRIAVVDVDGEVTVKRFYSEADGIRLVAENREMAPILLDVHAASRLRVIGEVQGVVRSLR
jgi:repressor LexA